jgi:uncharacterized short protein YbdD (DUF466 family)
MGMPRSGSRLATRLGCLRDEGIYGRPSALTPASYMRATFGCSSAARMSRSLAKRLARSLRELDSAGSFSANYLEHRRARHPGEPVMSQEARYATGKGRFRGCC